MASGPKPDMALIDVRGICSTIQLHPAKGYLVYDPKECPNIEVGGQSPRVACDSIMEKEGD